MLVYADEHVQQANISANTTQKELRHDLAVPLPIRMLGTRAIDAKPLGVGAQMWGGGCPHFFGGGLSFGMLRELQNP